MPSSCPIFLNEVLNEYMRMSYKRVLDVGVGFGKWGVLFREYGDIFRGRYNKNSWYVQIEGVEIFENYIQAHQKYIYNRIYFDDIYNAVKNYLYCYDFIFAGDIIEHLEKDRAKYVLNKLIGLTNASIMVCIPLGNNWQQGEVYNNKYEVHLSSWEHNDFVGWQTVSIKKDWKDRDIGLFKIRKI